MSHYFSRVQLLDHPLDLVLLAALSRHGAAYRDHVLIWRLFPGDGAARDFLFRRDVDARGKDFYYVVSKRAPQVEAGLMSVQSKPYSPRFQTGQWVRFDLRANPTVTPRVAAEARSRRHDVLMEAKRTGGGLPTHERIKLIDDAAIAWLTTRASEWGLGISGQGVLTNTYVQHKLRHKGRNIEFSSLDYQGLAQVTNPERLQERLVNGVGHARAFGCGLILVKRVA